MSIQAIVQFEVYILENDYWSLRARYLVADRDQAIIEARRIEQSTGLPTKVTRDTYYPEENRREEVTVYLNKNVKALLGHNRKGNSTNTGISSKQANNTTGLNTSRPFYQWIMAEFLFGRMLIAIGLSFGIATGLTVLFVILLDALNSSGARISSSTGNQMAFYWYLAMFALSMLALNRKLVPWRKMLAGRSSFRNLEMPSLDPEVLTTSDFMPKHPEIVQHIEFTVAQQEVKICQGDLEAQLEAVAPLVHSPTPEAENPLKLARVKTNNIQGETPALTQKKHEDASLACEAADTINGDGNSAEHEKDPYNLTFVAMEIERLQMIRLIGDAVLAIRKNQDHLDTNTRLGMSLFLAGAATSLADQRGLILEEEQNLLEESLRLIGHDEGSAERFILNLTAISKYGKNQDLISVGETAMRHKLEDSKFSVQGLGDILAQWNASAMPPDLTGDTFLLTYVERPDPNTAVVDEESIDRHTNQVRKTFLDYKGAEIRHTGKGVFARFHSAHDAVAAAISIQQDWQRLKTTDMPPPPTRIAVVSSDSIKSDPSVSGTVFSQADYLCRELGSSQIACDLLIRDVCASGKMHFGSKIPVVSNGIAKCIEAVKVNWELAPAASEATKY